MRVGAEHVGVDPAWPAQIERPGTGLIYLDLNHWIALAKAATGHPDGRRWCGALEVIRATRHSWTYVVGASLILEITGNRRRGQRRHLGALIEELTEFKSILPINVVGALEFEESLVRATARPRRLPRVSLVGDGVLYAFGMHGGLRVFDSKHRDVTGQLRAEATGGPAEFDSWITEAERLLDRGVVCGPTTDDEEAALRARGWDPSAARRMTEVRAQQEQALASTLDAEPRLRRGRLRDLIAGRYLALEIEEQREDTLSAHGLRLPQVVSSIDAAREFTDSMPTGDVWITLRTAKHRSASSRWTANDIFDIDALAVAAPYCDVVVTERHSAHVLLQSGVGERYATDVFTDVDQLAVRLGR